MKNIIIILFCISNSLQLIAQNNVDDLPVKTIDIFFDNDLFPNGSDNDYTTGLKFRLITEALDWKIPGLLKFKNRFAADQSGNHRYQPDKKEYNYRYNGFEVGLVYFTPDTLNSERVIRSQRPFSSMQYFTLSSHSLSKIRDWRLHNGSHYRELNTAFTLGLTGGPAAESLQRWMHEQLLKKPEIVPVGWPNQIGKTKNILVLNYMIEYSQLLNNSWLLPIKMKQTIQGRNRYNIFQWYNVHGGIKLNIGTMMNDVSVFFQINLLNVNRQYEHYLDFFREGFADVPHGDIEPKYRKKQAEQVIQVQNNYNHGMSERVESFLSDIQYLPETEYLNKLDEQIRISQNIEENQADNSQLGISDQLQMRKVKIRMRKSLHYKAFYRDCREKFFNNHSFKIFIRPIGRYVAHNGFLQGPLLYDRREDHIIRFIQPWVFQLELGLNWKMGAWEVEYKPYVWRTKEFSEQAPQNGGGFISPVIPGAVGNIKADEWHSWSSLVIRINPGMMYNAIKRNAQVNEFIEN